MNSSTNDDIVCTIFGRVFFFILQLVFRNEKYWRPSFFDGGMPTSIRSTEGTRIVYKIHLKWHIKTGFHIFRCSFEAECNAFFVVVVRLCACIFLKIQQFSFFPFLTIRIFVDRCHVFTSLSLSMDVRIVSACLYIYTCTWVWGCLHVYVPFFQFIIAIFIFIPLLFSAACYIIFHRPASAYRNWCFLEVFYFWDIAP